MILPLQDPFDVALPVGSGIRVNGKTQGRKSFLYNFYNILNQPHFVYVIIYTLVKEIRFSSKKRRPKLSFTFLQVLGDSRTPGTVTRTTSSTGVSM